MMYLRTGTPGNGKTLYTIDEVLKRVNEEGRDVYYSNIDGCKLEGWIELENGENWHNEIPDNAIYVCDEFYEVFPKVGATAKRPEHYQLLAKHRHRGLDVYLICQGVQQIDDFLKPLFENHHHLIRSEMFEQSKVFKSKGMIASPHTKGGRRDLETSSYVFNKDLYGKYKSATIHTHKKRIPKIYKQIFIAVLLLCLFVWFVLNFFFTKIENDKQVTGNAIPNKPLNVLHDSLKLPSNASEKSNYIASYEDFKPRQEGLLFTAKAYDQIRNEVKSYPRYQCFNNKGFCTCYTQQATRLNLDNTTCLNYMNNRNFEPSMVDWGLVGKENKMKKFYGIEDKNSSKDNEDEDEASLVNENNVLSSVRVK